MEERNSFDREISEALDMSGSEKTAASDTDLDNRVVKSTGKKSGKGKIVVGTILAVALAGNAALSIVTLNKLNENNKKTEKVVQYMDYNIYTEKDNPGVSVMKKDLGDDNAANAQVMNMNKDGITQDGVDGQEPAGQENPNDLALGDVLPGENDICIAGAYMIKSTENISDAYKSGDRSGLTDKEKETLDMAEKVIKEVIKPGMSDYEKEKAIYDWMTSHLANDSGMLSVIPTGMGDVDNPYGVLKYHNAVCVGYATTFRLFMHMLDIECRVVHNIDCHHSWDLVKLDGNWYHTDIYSDVGTNGYSHFNMNDEMMGTGQAWDRKTFPTADSLKYNILYREAIRPADIYQIPKDVRKAYDEHKGTVSFILNASDGEENCMKALKIVEEISDSFSMKYESSMYVMYNVVNVEEGYLLTVNLEWYIDGDDNYTDDNPLADIISDEDIEKMENAVSDAFSDVLGDIDFD